MNTFHKPVIFPTFQNPHSPLFLFQKALDTTSSFRNSTTGPQPVDGVEVNNQLLPALLEAVHSPLPNVYRVRHARGRKASRPEAEGSIGTGPRYPSPSTVLLWLERLFIPAIQTQATQHLPENGYIREPCMKNIWRSVVHHSRQPSLSVSTEAPERRRLSIQAQHFPSIPRLPG
jgi:hypothetical protein